MSLLTMRLRANNGAVAHHILSRQRAHTSTPWLGRSKAHETSDADSSLVPVAIIQHPKSLFYDHTSARCPALRRSPRQRHLSYSTGRSSLTSSPGYSSALHPSRGPSISGSEKTRKLLQTMRGIFPDSASIDRLPSFTEARYTSAEYQLSSEDFDLMDKYRQESFNWPRSLAKRKTAALVTHFEETLTLGPDDGQLEEALLLVLFAVLGESPSYQRAVRCWNFLSAARDASSSQQPTARPVQLIVNGLRRDEDYAGAAHVLRKYFGLVPSQTPAGLYTPLLQLSVFVLRSPWPRHRCHARAIVERMLPASSLELRQLRLPVMLKGGLLAALSRGGLGWADSRIAVLLANHLQHTVTPSSPSSTFNDEHRFCWTILTIWRALSSPSPESDSEACMRKLSKWVKLLGAKWILCDEAMPSIIHSIILRANSSKLDACETEEDVQALISSVTESCAGASPGRSSYGWGMRSLLGYNSSLLWDNNKLKSDADSQGQGIEDSSNFANIHEADILLDTFLSLPKSPRATPFLILPHLRALLAQFPPSIERAMSIYRKMHTEVSLQSRRGASKYLELFARRQKRKQNSSRSSFPEKTLPSISRSLAHGPDRETITLLLDHLFDSESFDRAGSQVEEIIKDTIEDEKELVLNPEDRVKYTCRLLCAVEGEGGDGSEALKGLIKSGRWISDWQNSHWQELVAHLAGLEGTHGYVESLDRRLRVSGDLLVAVVWQSSHAECSLGIQLYTTLLHKLGHVASFAPREDIWLFTSLIEDLHAVLIRDVQMKPDLPLLNALMNAYNRCEAPFAVHELWEGLTLVSLRSTVAGPEAGEESASIEASCALPPSKHSVASAAIDGATLAIYLDACGRHSGGSSRGRRAWALTARLQARMIKRAAGAVVVPIRNQNAWNSWLEFLCRRGQILEAIDELDAMTAELKATCGDGVGPDAKTLSMLLRFAARDRDLKAQRARDDSKAGFFEGYYRREEDVWWSLREKIKRNDSLRQFWPQIKDVGTPM